MEKTRVKIVRINTLSDIDTEVVNNAVEQLGEDVKVISIVAYVYIYNNLPNRLYVITYNYFEEEVAEKEEIIKE